MALFDGNLKQRLIGTVVLIVLAVVFLPMIFNNKGEKLPETIVTVPNEPQHPTITDQTPSNVVTTVTDNNQTNSTAVTPQQTAQTTAPTTNNTTQTTTSQTQQPPVTVSNTANTPPTTAPTTTAQTQSQANTITPSWTIQVAAVSNQKNADAFTDKLRKANYNAYTRKDGNLYRIFVGPFIKKTEAFRVQKLIEKQFKEKGIVREFKPEAQ